METANSSKMLIIKYQLTRRQIPKLWKPQVTQLEGLLFFYSLMCENGRYLSLDINKIKDLISIGHVQNGIDRCSTHQGFNSPWTLKPISSNS